MAVLVLIVSGVDRATVHLGRRQQEPITDNLAREIDTFIVRSFSHATLELAQLDEVRSVCTGRTGVDNPLLLRTLNAVQRILDVALVYILDSKGLVIASSSNAEDSSLTGNRYPFRPYFIQAMDGGCMTTKQLSSDSPFRWIHALLASILAAVHRSWPEPARPVRQGRRFFAPCATGSPGGIRSIITQSHREEKDGSV